MIILHLKQNGGGAKLHVRCNCTADKVRLQDALWRLDKILATSGEITENKPFEACVIITSTEIVKETI